MKHAYIIRTLLMALLMTLCLNLRAESTEIDGLYYTLDASSQTATLTGMEDKTATSLEIPSTVEYGGITYTVTALENFLCSDNQTYSLETLSIPASVETISSTNYLFHSCKSLKTLTLQDGGKTLVFKKHPISYNVKLEKLYLGRNVDINYNNSSTNNLFVISSSEGTPKTLTNLTIGPEVTTLKSYIFRYFSNLTIVDLPHVKEIGAYCFDQCTRLTTVSLGDALETVGDGAFSSCTNLTNLTFPSTIKTIGEDAFYNCSSITSVSFPSDCVLDSIGSAAFQYCSALTAFKCPETVSYIGSSAFKYCKKLVTVILGNKLTAINSQTFEEDVALSDMTVPEGVTSIGNRAFYDCTGIATYSLPSTLQSIGDYVFYNNSGLSRLAIPGNVTSIGSKSFDKCTSLANLTFEKGQEKIYVKSTFTDCPLTRLYLGRDLYSSNFENQKKLKRVTFWEGVTYMNDNLFNGCSAITKLSLPDSLRTVMTYVFANCTGLASLTFPGKVSSIGANSFDNCSALTSVTFEDGETQCAENGRFNSCPLQKVYIGRNLTYSSTSASPFSDIKTLTDVTFSQAGTVTFLFTHLLDGCSSVTELALPQSLKGIREYALCDMSRLKGITVYDNVTTIGQYCFANDTALATARLSDNITTLNSHLFYNCSKLDGFKIPTKVTSIADYVFAYCSSLSAISFSPNVTKIGDNSFNECTSLKDVTFEDGTDNLTVGYQTYSSKGMFRDDPVETLYLGRNLIYDNGVMYSPFAYATSLTSLTLGTKLTNIGKYAFQGCDKLPVVSMPDNITSIGQAAFKDCSKLNGLTLSNKLASVGEQSFMNDSILETVVLPASLDALSSQTFEGCVSLRNVDLGNTLNTIGPSAFKGCTSLKAITIPKSVYGFGVESFSGCTALRFMKVTEGIKSIGKQAFSGCTALEAVEFSENLVSIGDEAFTNCTGLTAIRSWAEIPPEGLANFPDTVKETATLYIPEDTEEDYKESTTWEDFFHFATISDNVKVDSIVLSKTELNIEKGETFRLEAIVYPVYANDTTLTWKSGDESVATVSDGTLTGIDDGTATITVSANDGSGVSVICNVVVGTGIPSGIGSIVTDSRDVIRLADGSLEISGSDGALAEVVNLSGAVCMKTRVSGGKTALNLPKGVYIVRVQGHAYKVCVR